MKKIYNFTMVLTLLVVGFSGVLCMDNTQLPESIESLLEMTQYHCQMAEKTAFQLQTTPTSEGFAFIPAAEDQEGFQHNDAPSTTTWSRLASLVPAIGWMYNNTSNAASTKPVILKMEEVEQSLTNTLNSSLLEVIKLDPMQKKLVLRTIADRIKQLNDNRDSLTNATTLIADNDQQLREKFEKSLRHITEHGGQIDQLYDALGFKNEHPHAISLEKVLERCNFFEQISNNCKYYGLEFKTGSLIRQIKFTIGNQYGKNIYDAWLLDQQKKQGNNYHLSMLRVDPAKVDALGLDVDSLGKLNSNLSLCSNTLQRLQKAIEKTTA